MLEGLWAAIQYYCGVIDIFVKQFIGWEYIIGAIVLAIVLILVIGLIRKQ